MLFCHFYVINSKQMCGYLTCGHEYQIIKLRLLGMCTICIYRLVFTLLKIDNVFSAETLIYSVTYNNQIAYIFCSNFEIMEYICSQDLLFPVAYKAHLKSRVIVLLPLLL